MPKPCAWSRFVDPQTRFSTLHSGEGHVLLTWIEALPRHVLDENAWLIYWRGVALAATRSLEALTTLGRAAALFGKDGNVQGRLLACSEGLNCAFRLFSFSAETDILLDAVLEVLDTNGLTTPQLRLRALTGAIIGLLYRRPTDPHLPLYATELVDALPTIDTAEDAVKSATAILEYFNHLGAFKRSTELIKLVEPLLRGCVPTQRFNWLSQVAWHYCYTGQKPLAVRSADRAYRCAQREDLQDLLYLGLSVQCVAALQFGDLEGASGSPPPRWKR